MEITSINNAYIKELVKLKHKKYRDQKRSFLIEGIHLCDEANTAGVLKQLIIRKDSTYHTSFENTLLVSDEVMNKLSTTVSLVDVIGLCSFFDQTEKISNKVVILDNVQDPGNVGTIIRTAIAFGYNDIFLSLDSVDLYNEKLIRSSQGAIFKANVRSVNIIDLISKLKQDDYKVYGTALDKASSLQSFERSEQVALVFGNEGQGVSKELLNVCDDNIFIEIQGFESLNVAIAAGICLYHFRNFD